MTDEYSDERLEAVLTSVGHHLEIPPRPADSARVAERAGRLLAVAAAITIIVAVTLGIPSTRAAIADFLGIGSTRIEITSESDLDGTALPHIAKGLPPISVDEATAILGGDLPDTSATNLGPPDAVYRMPEGGVLLGWEDGAATLWVRAATDTDVIIRKLVGSDEAVETVDGLGTEALILTGAHILQTPQRRLAADSVLLWHDDGREYRLEADLDRTGLIDLALGIK